MFFNLDFDRFSKLLKNLEKTVPKKYRGVKKNQF